jgi:hypothetical protein
MPQTRRAKQAGSAAVDRLRASIEAAETALKDLQGEVSRDSRDLLKDVGATLKTARRNLSRSRQRIVKDLEQFERALVKGKGPVRPAPKATAPKRPTAARRASSTKASKPARRTSAAKRPAKRSKAA